MSTVTHANGVPIRPRGNDSLPARRLAAAFERGGSEIVEYIKCNAFGGPVARIDTDTGSTARIQAPPGWRIERVNVVTSGAVYVTFEREEDA